MDTPDLLWDDFSMINLIKKHQIFLAWLIAMIATVGSLFFSEVMEFIPCSLCWYQRIFMYPLSLILLIGFFGEDQRSMTYAFILSVVGAVIALYHNLLVWDIIPETASPCVQGIPCNATYIDWLGFITIPLLSLSAFLLIITVYLLGREYEK